MAQAVEAVAPQAPVARPLERHGVGAGGLRNGGVEGGVEDGDVRHVRPGLLGGLDAFQVDRVVQRRQLRQGGDRPLHLRRHPHARREHRPAVDDAMADGGDLHSLFFAQQRQDVFDGRAAAVGGQRRLDGVGARVAQRQFRGLRGPVGRAVEQHALPRQIQSPRI